MRRILVVANLTLGGEHLVAALRERIGDGPCELFVLVPAAADPNTWTHTEQQDLEHARQRLDAALERFSQLGAEVTGEIGDARPVDAIHDVLRRRPFDEIILSTLPPGLSRWLRMDLVRRVERSVDIPVTHVAARDEDHARR